METVSSRNLYDDPELFQARLAAFAFHLRHTQKDMRGSGAIYDELSNITPTQGIKMPRGLSKPFREFLSGQEYESEIQYRRELLRAYTAQYSDLVLPDKRFDRGSEADIYKVGELIIKFYRSDAPTLSPARSIDDKMACSFITNGKQDFEVVRGASFAERRLVCDYIDGTNLAIACKGLSQTYLSSVTPSLIDRAHKLRVGGDTNARNIIYRPEDNGLSLIDLNYCG